MGTENEPQQNGDEASANLPVTPDKVLSLDENHLAVFRKCYPKPPLIPSGNDREGKSPREWYSGGPIAKPAVDLDRFGECLNRSRLFDLQADRTTSTLELCISILAWGGMHGSNRNHLFNRSTEPWLEVAEAVRNGRLARQDAFAAFAKLNRKGKLVGMGPAYYTKLIYFLMPRDGACPVGYIMDQWLGCSVNLICQQEVVRMDTMVIWTAQKRGAARSGFRRATSRVSPLNTSEHYERFCQAVELLAERMGAGWTPDATELALMSSGGYSPAPWRSYVIQRRLLSLAC